MARAGWAMGLVVLVSCGGANEKARLADPPEAEPTAEASATRAPGEGAAKAEAPKEDPPPRGMPTACGKGSTDQVCLPPAYFAKGLCNGDYPTVALAMFAKGTPWTRGYSVTKATVWNASGGASSNEKLHMYEELIVLRQRIPAEGGIQVSGSGTSYDVLRWDGSCVTLQEGELVFQHPPKVANMRIIFKRLEMHVRDALKDEPDLRELYLAHRRECKGVTMGSVTKKCEVADRAFSEAIAAFVREKGRVPEPKKLPLP